MEEVNKRKCRLCCEEKNRILAGKFPGGYNKKWVGDSGKLWSGNICPECNVIRTKSSMQKLRNKNVLP